MKRPGTTTRRTGTIRCAIYTRKSSEEGLEQEFNSLQAQREACEAFIKSQRHEGWMCQRAAYDDGGFSGATMDRPALQQLLADITAGRIDTVVAYKIDRLTRSLADFCQDRRDPQRQGRVLCFGDAAVQHDDLDGALDPQRAVVLRAARARGHRRAHSRQIWPNRDIAGVRRYIEILRVSADLVVKPAAHTRAEAGVLDARTRIRERDRLSAGGRWIRTIGPRRSRRGHQNHQ